jgi:hypothetical protein
MIQLEIALKLREQIKEQWPFVSTILALHENNKGHIFTDRIQRMIDRLLPDAVFYHPEGQRLSNRRDSLNMVIERIPIIVGIKSTDKYGYRVSVEGISSLPINQVLFASEDNPLGILK